MVIFSTRSEIEKHLSPEEMEKADIRRITASDTWQDHLDMHKKSGIGEAKLFVPGEPVLGKKGDALRERFGLKEQEVEVSLEETKSASAIYGPVLHEGAVHYMGANDPNRPGFWATCNCGAEFNATEGEDGKMEVKSYNIDSSVNDTAYRATSGSTTYDSNSPKPTIYG